MNELEEKEIPEELQRYIQRQFDEYIRLNLPENNNSDKKLVSKKRSVNRTNSVKNATKKITHKNRKEGAGILKYYNEKGIPMGYLSDLDIENIFIKDGKRVFNKNGKLMIVEEKKQNSPQPVLQNTTALTTKQSTPQNTKLVKKNPIYSNQLNYEDIIYNALKNDTNASERYLKLYPKENSAKELYELLIHLQLGDKKAAEEFLKKYPYKRQILSRYEHEGRIRHTIPYDNYASGSVLNTNTDMYNFMLKLRNSVPVDPYRRKAVEEFNSMQRLVAPTSKEHAIKMDEFADKMAKRAEENSPVSTFITNLLNSIFG